MNLELPDGAVEFGREAGRALRHAGGVDLARRAIADPDVRTDVVASLLARMGVEDLRGADDADTLLAASELCRVSGSVALPYPVAGLVSAREDGVPVSLVDPRRPLVDHGDLFGRWRTVDVSGAVAEAFPDGARQATRLGPFVTPVRVRIRTDARQSATGTPQAARWLTFSSAVLLGAAQEAFRITVQHVQGRTQFGQALAGFQSVRFRLAEDSTALAGLEELCRFTVVRLATGGDRVVVDALGLRLRATVVSRQILRSAQQLHGATGFCNEYDLPMLTRVVQAGSRVPFDRPETVRALLRAVDRYGFGATFAVAPALVVGA